MATPKTTVNPKAPLSVLFVVLHLDARVLEGFLKAFSGTVEGGVGCDLGDAD